MCTAQGQSARVRGRFLGLRYSILSWWRTRQREVEPASPVALDRALNSHPTAKSLGDSLGDGQSEALSRGLDLVEPFEGRKQPVLFLGRQARTSVADPELDIRVMFHSSR